MATTLMTTPLDDAVRKIIKGSHLNISSESYVHPTRISEAVDQEIFPIISSSTRLVTFTSVRYYATVFVDIILPIPRDIITGVRELDSEILSAHTHMYQRDLTDISHWIIGKRKHPTTNKKLMPDVRLADNLEFPGQIRIYYGLSNTGGAAELTSIRKLMGREDVFVVQLRLTVWSQHDKFVTPSPFSPDIEDFQ